MTMFRQTGGINQAFVRLLTRFVVARQGNVAMIFAIVMPVLILLTVGGVDIHRASAVRANLQDSLDAATLAAARSPFVTDADLTRVGLAALRANLAAYPQISLREDLTTFTLTEDSVVVAAATVDVDALVANIILPPYGQILDDTLPVRANSEVDRSSKNIEVSLVLDITGSMAGQRIIDLKAAAKDLVDIVVQDVQTPFYTRVAVVPYSMGVNAGGYADTARGTVPAAKSISGASWSIGTAKNISGITRASPGVVTSNGHGFATGEWVWIRNVSGMTQVNNRAYRVAKIDNNKYSLQSWNGSSWAAVNTTSGNGYSTYSSGGTAQKCQVSDCSVVVTANNHGLTNGAGAYITNVAGMTQINASASNSVGYEVANVTTNTFSIGVNGAAWGNYSSGGTLLCGADGCGARVFRNSAGSVRGLPISTCVSERPGAQAHTDATPTSTARVGRNYPTTEAGNGCPSAVVRPLSDNKNAIKSMIDDLTVVGSTAGQIGIAWGWYTVSPNFNSLWSGSPAGTYAPNDTVKSVIIMTDGEFNTPYCTGVIAQNAGTGSGGNTNKINCNGNNPFDEGEALCTAMKSRGVVVYTVGFQIAEGGEAEELMQDCATSAQHVYLPETGGDLSEAFNAIGRDITRLRISK